MGKAQEWLTEHHVSLKKTGAEDPQGEEVQVEPILDFRDSRLSRGASKGLLKTFGKTGSPTVIQSVSWSLILDKHDVVGIAKTGSGKTLAFLVPFVVLTENESLKRLKKVDHARCLTLAPTRELAIQTGEVITSFLKAAKIEYPVVILVGGIPKAEQTQAISDHGCEVTIGTPGRLLDLVQCEWLYLSRVQFLVLDEADRMLDMGFVEVVKQIVDLCPSWNSKRPRQSVLFSATWPTEVSQVAREFTCYHHNPVYQIRISRKRKAGEISEDLHVNNQISQEVIVVSDRQKKLGILKNLCQSHKTKKVIVFALYKKEASWLESVLKDQGHNPVGLHGDMSQEARNLAISKFRDNVSRFLVATDVASRGLDIPDVDLVINFTFPLTVEDFVHRVGRTARGKRQGQAITLFNENGDHGEKEHSHLLVKILKEANQPVPADLQKLSESTFCSTKRKAHPLFGNHFKSEEQMAKLAAQRVHMVFSDSD